MKKSRGRPKKTLNSKIDVYEREEQVEVLSLTDNSGVILTFTDNSNDTV